MKDFGIQLYTVRNTMDTAENIRMTFRRLREMGYTQGQTAGCAIPYAEYGQIAKEEGIEIIGTHDNFAAMEADFETALANHKALGTTNMGTGGFFPKELEKVEVWEEYIEKVKAFAEKCGKAGMKFTYHNHSHEFIKLENGKRPMDMLVEALDPATTSFVLDTFWVQHGGGDIYEWIEKLAGRIDILHLKDMKRLAHFDEKRGYQMFTEVGNGNLNWPKIIEVAKKAGVKYFVVEQDTCPGDPFDSAKMSADYVKTL